MLTGAWEAFAETVKHRVRYVMWLQPRDEDGRADGEVAPAEILDEVGDLLRRLPGRLHRLDPGTRFWRARSHDDPAGEGCRSAQGLGTAPREHARQANRMSPAGLPLFYGARAADTAVQETVRRVSPGSVTYGSFETSRPCVVVDLTKMPDVSMFDPVWGRSWRYLRFLDEFAATSSQPVQPGDEHTEYVPTQIVTEYLLRIFRDQHGRAVDGLLYDSSVTGGQCVVLDVPNDARVMRGAPTVGDRLELSLDEDSLETRRVDSV